MLRSCRGGKSVPVWEYLAPRLKISLRKQTLTVHPLKVPLRPGPQSGVHQHSGFEDPGVLPTEPGFCCSRNPQPLPPAAGRDAVGACRGQSRGLAVSARASRLGTLVYVHRWSGRPLTFAVAVPLQINAVSLYLLYLVEMISSGLQIVYNTDEVRCPRAAIARSLGRSVCYFLRLVFSFIELEYS